MAKKPTLFQKLQDAMNRRKIERFSADSYAWLKREAGKLRGEGIARQIYKDKLKASAVVRSGKFEGPQIGRMFLYEYDAKGKDDMEYWDAQPLIFLVQVNEDGSWFGLNVHYIPPAYRAKLMDALLEFANNKRYDKTTKLKLSYQLLKAASQSKTFQFAFKKYLPSQLRSQLVRITAEEWETALFLPLARFKKEPNSKVWSDYVKSLK